MKAVKKETAKKKKKKSAAPRVSKTRKQTAKKNKMAASEKAASNPPWRPRAKSKQEKELRALRSHPRRERSTRLCIVALCPKLALMNYDHCARHLGAIQNAPGYNNRKPALLLEDAIVYGTIN